MSRKLSWLLAWAAWFGHRAGVFKLHMTPASRISQARIAAAIIGLPGLFVLVLGFRAAASETASLPKGLAIVHGPVNGAFIELDGKALAVYGDPSGQRPAPEMVLLTHARRDAVWAARAIIGQGATVVAPDQESDLLEHPERFWAELREKRYHDYGQQTTKVPVEPMPVARRVKGGDVVAWGNLAFRVLDTPGYTRGAVSYVAELDGKKVIFTGDLIRDDGKLQDLFSFQDAIPEAKIGGYHGWAARLGQLMTSLDKVEAEKPDLLVPLHGPVIREPLATIDRLRTRVRAVYANYLSVDALRWYFRDEHIRTKGRRVLASDAPVHWMAMAETPPLPEQIVAISNSRLILAADGSGFLADCGGAGIIEELRKLRTAGKLTSLEHVFVTHYHDDHTDALPALVAEFGAKVHACGSLIDLLERPGDYRLPCLTKNPVAVTARHNHGETWQWKEFQLTIYDFPGQTLHHNALLLQQNGGWSAFLAGDSFTPTGIDDYCLQNRNFLAEGEGFLRCLAELDRLPAGCLILNQHVDPPFRFSPAQVALMRDTLRRRMPVLAELFPFDDLNYGLDESWAVLHPYWVTVRPGDKVKLELRIMNHSSRERSYRTNVRAPQGFVPSASAPVRILARAGGLLKAEVQLPEHCPPGLHVVTADVGWEDEELREWTEAVIEVRP